MGESSENWMKRLSDQAVLLQSSSNLKFYILDCIPQSLRNQGLRFFCIKTSLIMHFGEKNGKLLFNGLACLQNSSTIFMI